MAAHIGGVGNHLQRLVAHILGMGSSKPHPHLRRCLCHHTEQLWEGHFKAVGRGMIGIHILSQQCHLLETSRLQVGHLTEDTVHIARALTTTSVGHDAIVAEIVAATHDAHKSTNMAAGDTLWHHIAVCLGGGKFDIDGFLSHLSLRDEVG